MAQNYSFCFNLIIHKIIQCSDSQSRCMGSLHSTDSFVITARKRSLGQGNIFSSVCQEFCSRGGVCLSACWDTTSWVQGTSQGPGHPPRTRHPPSGSGMPLPQGPGTPLRSACWEIRSTSGLYASYWNAILLRSARRMVLTLLHAVYSRQSGWLTVLSLLGKESGSLWSTNSSENNNKIKVNVVSSHVLKVD